MKEIATLIHALDQNDMAQFKTLLEQLDVKHINAHDGSIDKKTLMESAIENLNEEAVQLVVQKGANINSKNPLTGRTPLLQLVTESYKSEEKQSKRDNMINLLAKLGADFNAQDSIRRNAIILALVYKNLRLIKPLQEKGTDINATDQTGDNAFSYVGLRYELPLRDELLQSIIDLGGKLPPLKQERAQDLLKLQSFERHLSENKNKKEEMRLNSMMNSLRDIENVEQDPNEPDAEGMTPFYRKILEDPYTAKMLVHRAMAIYGSQKRINPNIETPVGNALHVALSVPFKEIDDELIVLLVQCGTKLTTKNKAGLSPIDIAKQKGVDERLMQNEVIREALRKEISAPENLQAPGKSLTNPVVSGPLNSKVNEKKIDSLVKALFAGSSSIYNSVYASIFKPLTNTVDSAHIAQIILDKCEKQKNEQKPKNSEFYDTQIDVLKARISGLEITETQAQDQITSKRLVNN